MALIHAVLGKLQRKTPDSDIEILLPTDAPAVDGPIFSLFEQAKTQFNRNANKRFGFFESAAEHPLLPDSLKQWQNTQYDFLALCHKLTHHLLGLLNSTEVAFIGQLLFAEEELLGQHYFYCLWLPSVEAIQVGNDLLPYHTHIINTQQLPYALRLHINQWQENETAPKYLTIIAGRGNKAFGDAFMQWSTFAEGIDTRQQTEEFLTIVDNFSEKLPEEKARAIKKTAIDYCVNKDKVGAAVHIDELSPLINENAPTAFAEFVINHQAVPTKEIHTDRSSLKRYMRYFGRDHSLSISFSADRFGTDIIYNASANTLSIEKIPKSLKAQLSGYENKES